MWAFESSWSVSAGCLSFVRLVTYEDFLPVRSAFKFSPRGFLQSKKQKLSPTPMYPFFLCALSFRGKLGSVL